MRLFLSVPVAVLVAIAFLYSAHAQPAPVDFGRQIRPLLSDNCFTCHGPDKADRKAKLRLDTHDGATADLGGYAAVTPGDAEASELIRRIITDDDIDLMPPPDSGKALTADQKDLLTRWIQEGAPWQEHWAFIPPQTQPLPQVQRQDWPRNAIDHFVLARLEAENLEPSAMASKETLIRRLTLDLTGLPPAPAEIDAFLTDESPNAYEQLVDRLLASPRYGEQMARYWLDGARYGDTHGLHIDNERSIWPYRDWVVQAINDNMPFDQFTLEQIAGDLLPNPARDQLVATGFNRCNVTTSEGGAIPEEFAVRYAVDRTETLATVWMGLTAGCAACHDHKYDPISQKEFYQLFAFYNNLDENPMDGNALLPPPVLALPSPAEEQSLARLDDQVELVDKVIQAARLVVDYQEPPAGRESTREPADYVWFDDELPKGAQASSGGESWKLVGKKDGPVFSGEQAAVRTAEENSQQYFTDAQSGLLIGEGDRLFAQVYLDPQNPPREIMLQFNVGGWKHRAFWGEDLVDYGKKDSSERRHIGPLPQPGQWIRLDVDVAEVGLEPGTVITGWAFTQYGGTVYWDRAGLHTRTPQAGNGFDSFADWEAYQSELKKPDLPEPLVKVLRKERGERSRQEQRQLQEYFIENDYARTRPVFDPLHGERERLKKQRQEVDGSITRSLITRERKEAKTTHVLLRGEYDKPGDKVDPDVPAVLPPFPTDQPANRLGLARWLTDPNHPLTARVTVNRLWQQHFGEGLVRTTDNFGAQGEPPSHPALLDWLAWEFTRNGWDTKAMHRLMILSATYRQSSVVRPDILTRDPGNRLLARGPRYRLDAEVIRDSMLAVSGLLNDTLGGRGVRPYQPDGIWEAVSYPSSTTANYRRDSGEALYRRSLYTFWKRTAPPPPMITLDAPTRESCRVRRERTNTPLQALLLLNDIQFIEAARHLAVRVLRDVGNSTDDRLAYGFRLVTGRYPDATEQSTLRRLYEQQAAHYRQQPEAAEELLGIGESSVDPVWRPSELAAWTLVANTLLNLSEAITLN